MSATNRMNRKTDYITEYQWAREDPNSFWETQSQAIDWFEPPKTILQTDENGIERWFPDGVMNTCWLALDYHCENGRGGNTALIYDSPVTGTQSSYTYNQLRDQVAKVARMLAMQGVTLDYANGSSFDRVVLGIRDQIRLGKPLIGVGRV